eukprot:scaffold228217_cov23-Tisochrysis_lutea.AAC.2
MRQGRLPPTSHPPPPPTRRPPQGCRTPRATPAEQQSGPHAALWVYHPLRRRAPSWWCPSQCPRRTRPALTLPFAPARPLPAAARPERPRGRAASKRPIPSRRRPPSTRTTGV